MTFTKVVPGVSLLALLAAACDVSVGECRRDDAGACVDLFADERPMFDGGLADASSGGADGGTGTDGALGVIGLDADLRSDGEVPSAPDGGGATGPRLTVEQLCDALNSAGLAWANKLDECCISEADRASQDVRDIPRLFNAYSDESTGACITAYKSLIDDGSVTYDPARADACAVEFLKAYPAPSAACPAGGFDYAQLAATVGHGAPQLAQLTACREALRGKRLRDQSCTRNFECAVGLTCLPIFTGSAQSSTCREPSLAGGRCENNGHCAGGLACVGDRALGRTCRRSDDLVLIGACESSQECVVGSVCVGGKCEPLPARTAADAICL